MRFPVEGEPLTAASGEVWIVLRCHMPDDGSEFFALDLIRQQDLPQISHSLNLTWDEFEDFCRQQGIVYPPP